MSVAAALDTVLCRLSDVQLATLAGACDPLARPSPVCATALAGASPAALDAVRELTAAWDADPAITGAGVALALRVGAGARRQSQHNRPRPVWTGPGALGEQRLTAAVLHELLARAEDRILLVSFAAHTLPTVAADLRAAVARGCQVDVVFENSQDSDGRYRGHDHAFATIDGITRWRWPAEQREGGGVLHAKLLVIDGQRALIGSANLTHQALRANLEVGLAVADPGVAAALESHIRGLMRSGVLALA